MNTMENITAALFMEEEMNLAAEMAVIAGKTVNETKMRNDSREK